VVSGQIGAVTREAQGTDAAVNEMRTVAGAVADQIGELRSVMIRIVRTSSDAANRRSDERVPVNLPTALIINGATLPAICLNLSRGGARVRAEQMLAAGTSVILKLPGLPDLTGRILTGGLETSMSFAWSADAAPAELCGWLDGRAAA
jgi:hypothetical protein